MADTDEASIAFVGDAEKAVRSVQSDVAALQPLLRDLSFEQEAQALDGFGKHFAEYREIDRQILTLAVENTNLKAQKLAFGPASQAAEAFRDSLARLAANLPPRERCGAGDLVAKAVLAVREIQVLYAPHIAESNDAAMTRMEQEMASLDATARAAVASLAELGTRNAHLDVAAALSALDRVKDISSQIVALSRRNTNVRSLELSLRNKPSLTAACDQSLRSLQDLLAKEDIKATR